MREDADPAEDVAARRAWLTPGVGGIGAASFLTDVGHEVPTALLPSVVTTTLDAPAAALGLIEGIADGLAGAGRFVGGAISDDPQRRRTLAMGGYTATAVLSGLIGVTTSVLLAGALRGAAWAARGLRVPARNALLADVVPAHAYGRAYGFERTMDNLGSIVGSLLALGLVALLGVRTAILISIIPGLFAALAIVYAIEKTAAYRRHVLISLAGGVAQGPRDTGAVAGRSGRRRRTDRPDPRTGTQRAVGTIRRGRQLPRRCPLPAHRSGARAC